MGGREGLRGRKTGAPPQFWHDEDMQRILYMHQIPAKLGKWFWSPQGLKGTEDIYNLLCHNYAYQLKFTWHFVKQHSYFLVSFSLHTKFDILIRCFNIKIHQKISHCHSNRADSVNSRHQHSTRASLSQCCCGAKKVPGK